MIRYALVCDKDHDFEAWFKGADDFDSQSGRGLISCPVCGSASVDKALMAPSVSTSRQRETRSSVSADNLPVPAQQQAVAAPDPRMTQLLDAMRELKKQVTENADYVGSDFAEEARKIHYGETEERGIYGETTIDEARGLLDEGIEVHPVPILPDERN